MPDLTVLEQICDLDYVHTVHKGPLHNLLYKYYRYSAWILLVLGLATVHENC